MELLGAFTLIEVDPPGSRKALNFTATMTKAPVVTAGYGGWSKVARPRRKALTEWVGRDPVSITIEFMMDSPDDAGLPTETAARTLESIAGLDSNDPEPPLCLLLSNPPALMPHGYHRAAHVRWFVETLTWDADQTHYNKEGNRIRTAGTVVVTQYVEDTKLSGLAAGGKGKSTKGKKGSRRKTYRVKKGDTLSGIAARKDTYNDPKRWVDIKKANGIRDSKNLKVGKVLKLP